MDLRAGVTMGGSVRSLALSEDGERLAVAFRGQGGWYFEFLNIDLCKLGFKGAFGGFKRWFLQTPRRWSRCSSSTGRRGAP